MFFLTLVSSFFDYFDGERFDDNLFGVEDPVTGNWHLPVQTELHNFPQEDEQIALFNFPKQPEYIPLHNFAVSGDCGLT